MVYEKPEIRRIADATSAIQGSKLTPEIPDSEVNQPEMSLAAYEADE